VGYPLGDLAQDTPLTMTLTIPELEQSLPEVIPDTELQAALAALRTQGIDLSIWTVSGSGGGGGGYTINSKPDGMSDEEVMRIYYQTLGYYYAGPWVFTFDVP
jgi:phosphatidylserine/phosphatidylglycerophosphate/cardiolipin synthase-like enzyme